MARHSSSAGVSDGLTEGIDPPKPTGSRWLSLLLNPIGSSFGDKTLYEDSGNRRALEEASITFFNRLSGT
jgi:hypothetical protein